MDYVEEDLPESDDSASWIEREALPDLFAGIDKLLSDEAEMDKHDEGSK